jgi:hypothetical protein
MSPEELTSFFVKRGHRVVQTASCWWYNEYHQERVFYSYPIHRFVNPGPDEIEEVFSSASRALVLRFISPVDTKGKKSFIWMRGNPYDLTDLSAKSRNQTRRGLEKCEIRKITWDELETIAQEAHTDTMNRHQVNSSVSLGFGADLGECPAYEAWGAFVDGSLAAYIVTQWVEDWVHILFHRSADAHLKAYPNNALIFSAVKELLSREGVLAVSYGLEPLTTLGSLEHFKLGMGFVKEPVCQRIVVTRWLKPLLNSVTCRVVEAVASLRPDNLRLQRVAGVCRLIRQS